MGLFFVAAACGREPAALTRAAKKNTAAESVGTTRNGLRIKYLTLPQASTGCLAIAMNRWGAMLGTCDSRNVLWASSDADPVVLPDPSVGGTPIVHAINANGDVVGWAQTPAPTYQTIAVSWHGNGTWSPSLLNPSGTSDNLMATTIAGDGTVYGSGTDLGTHAHFVWQSADGAFSIVENRQGMNPESNDVGQTVWYSVTGVAKLWDGSTLSILPSGAGLSLTSTAPLFVTDQEVIVSAALPASGSGGWQPFTWTPDGDGGWSVAALDMGTLSSCLPRASNARGDIVADCNDNEVVIGRDNQLIDWGALMVPSGAMNFDSQLAGISDAGIVFGQMSYNTPTASAVCLPFVIYPDAGSSP